MAQLFRVFLLKALYGWRHGTALVEYLEQQPALRRQLEFETIPDQSTLWQSWRNRFTAELRDTIETAARTILRKAAQAGVSVPRAPPNTRPQAALEAESTLDDRAVLDRAAAITEHLGRIVYPAFSLDRGPAVFYIASYSL